MCKPDIGPCFRGDFIGSELAAVTSPFDGYKNCYSNANLSAYRIPVDGAGKNMLTNCKKSNFTITELEVWQVEYLE